MKNITAKKIKSLVLGCTSIIACSALIVACAEDSENKGTAPQNTSGNTQNQNNQFNNKNVVNANGTTWLSSCEVDYRQVGQVHFEKSKEQVLFLNQDQTFRLFEYFYFGSQCENSTSSYSIERSGYYNINGSSLELSFLAGNVSFQSSILSGSYFVEQNEIISLDSLQASHRARPRLKFLLNAKQSLNQQRTLLLNANQGAIYAQHGQLAFRRR